MDETQELLRAIMSRLEEMSADFKGLRTEVSDLRTEVSDLRTEVKEFRADTGVRLEKIEERLDYLAVKWMDHDEEILKLKRRRS